MGKRITLPSGAWADLRPSSVITERQRRPIKRAMASVSQEGWIAQQNVVRIQQAKQAGEPIPADLAGFVPQFSNADVDAYAEANDWGVLAMVESWSYPQPVTIDSLMDLPTADYDALQRAVADPVAELFVNLAPTPDPASPIAPSEGSETSSEGSPVSQNGISPTIGEPIASSSSDSP